jgi:hypothetical protein
MSWGVFGRQDTTRRSKRLRGNADIDVHSLTGFAHWRNLPWELQKTVLVSRALSLHDLAKLATLGKVFKEAYLERCAKEEQWLEHAAVSVFGAQPVDALVCWLSSPKRVDDAAGLNPPLRLLKLSEGEPWPDLRSKLLFWGITAVQQPACFLPGDLKDVNWDLDSSYGGRRRTIWMREGTRQGPPILKIEFYERQLCCFLYPRVPAHVLPCLGLVYLGCKKAAESFGRWRNPGPRQGWRFGYARVFTREWIPEDPRNTYTIQPLNNVLEEPPDTQRAFTAISMRSCSSVRRKFGVCLQWQGWGPLLPPVPTPTCVSVASSWLL